MKKIMMLCLLGLITFTGCYYAPVMPPGGILFESVQAPLDVDMDKTPMVEKKGEASSMSVLALIAFGDCSTATAAKNGNIKTINHADYKYMNILFGIYQSFSVVVYGE